LAQQISRADQKSEKATGFFWHKNVKIAIRTTKITSPSFSLFVKFLVISIAPWAFGTRGGNVCQEIYLFGGATVFSPISYDFASIWPNSFKNYNYLTRITTTVLA
jgi:hypothetical protein